MSRFFEHCAVLSGLCFILAGCASSADRGSGKGSAVIDLTDRFVQIMPALDSAGGGDSRPFLHHLSVTRRGRQEDAIALVAPVSVAAPLTNFSGRARLDALVAPVFNVGDGFDMSVFLSDGRDRRRVYERYFDPGRRASDRDWIPLQIPLELAPGREWRVEVQVSAGPQNDLVGDWLALARVRVVERDAY